MRILFLILIFLTESLTGQVIDQTKLFIEGSEVVCEFNKTDLYSYLNNKESKLYEFRAFDLEKIITENNSWNWSKNKWYLFKIDQDKYQLRKKLKDFTDEIPQHYKYLIDHSQWESPTSEPILKLNNIKDNAIPKPKPYSIREDGNSTFNLVGYPNAKQVILSGSFNNWNEDEIKMKRVGDLWTIVLDLSPGIYEYKFIADGDWTHDVKNPYTVVNQHQTLNSILLVGGKVTFKLDGYDHAKKVILAGSFNNWNEEATRLTKTANGWQIDISLPPGKHFYKFIVDGKWLLDPTNNLEQRDKDSHVNSVKLIH